MCSDSELIQRTSAGDREAYEKLYKRYARSVFGLALRRLGDRGRAEDAVQETFASVWRSAGTYKPERGPGAPWLYGVARNAIVDRSRVRSRAAGRDCPTRPRSTPSPEERAEQAWTSWRVHRALEALPEREREVLALAYWSDLSQSEVADEARHPARHREDADAQRAPAPRDDPRGASSNDRSFDDLDRRAAASTPDERQRLESVHDLLVAAGPPPELPAALREPPAPAAATPVVPITSAGRRKPPHRAAR